MLLFRRRLFGGQRIELRQESNSSARLALQQAHSEGAKHHGLILTTKPNFSEVDGVQLMKLVTFITAAARNLLPLFYNCSTARKTTAGKRVGQRHELDSPPQFRWERSKATLVLHKKPDLL